MSVTHAQIERIIILAKIYGAKRLILFGSAVASPSKARDIDLACDGIPGWKLYELAARLEDELHISLDITPLKPPNKFTKYIESKGEVLL
ncbi:MAG: nucleotidyltransferase domain-containing protein [Bacteroidia bacterium]|nr:nucleotidyltransferase domain-containing protein [Bacteroidia bacterium]